jgi:hypothetical protein
MTASKLHRTSGVQSSTSSSEGTTRRSSLSDARPVSSASVAVVHRGGDDADRVQGRHPGSGLHGLVADDSQKVAGAWTEPEVSSGAGRASRQSATAGSERRVVQIGSDNGAAASGESQPPGTDRVTMAVVADGSPPLELFIHVVTVAGPTAWPGNPPPER